METNSVYSFDGTTWQVAFTASGVDIIYALEPFAGKLWLIANAGGLIKVGYYDGSGFVLDSNWPTLTAGTTSFAIESYNGRLFVGFRSSISGVIVVALYVQQSDGTWERVVGPQALSAFLIWSLKVYDGVLYIGTFQGVGSPAKLYSYSEQDNWFAVGDFQGGPFTAPPRSKISEKRHRYIFSWDRKNFINNLDDKAMVGLGFVPRYLALRGKD